MKLRYVKRICIALLTVIVALVIIMGLTKASVYGYMAIGITVLFGVVNIAFWRCPHCGKCLGRLDVQYCATCGGRIEE